MLVSVLVFRFIIDPSGRKVGAGMGTDVSARPQRKDHKLDFDCVVMCLPEHCPFKSEVE